MARTLLHIRNIVHKIFFTHKTRINCHISKTHSWSLLVITATALAALGLRHSR